MKILVLGSLGMAGHTITMYLSERGYDVTAHTRTPFTFCNNIIGDAFDTSSLKNTLLRGNYDFVINCIGILNKDAEDNPSKAVFLNGYLPHFLADTIKDTKTKLIHMSTDCVFAGNTGPYMENSFKDGKTFYDRTKAIGEIEDNINITFRNSIIGPDINENGIGLFNWFMTQEGEINGFTKAMWTGVTTLTLAKAMEFSIENQMSGLYNLVNNTNISKYDLLLLFNKYFRENKLNINQDSSLNLDKTLISTRKDLNFIVPSYEQQVIEMKEWVYNHKEIYPHYFK